MSANRWRVYAWIFAIVASYPGGRAWGGDAVTVEGKTYDRLLRIHEISDGKLVVLVDDVRKEFDLEKVEHVRLEGYPKFNQAEDSRRDKKEAGELYRAAAKYMHDTYHRPACGLALLRTAQAMHAEGKWLEAVKYFCDACEMVGTKAIWKFRPKEPEDNRILAEGAKLLDEHATKLGFDGQNLLRWEIELLRKSGETRTDAVEAKIAELETRRWHVSFCGIPATAHRVVFIVDHSASMADKFDVLRKETVRSVNRLYPWQKFNVAMFSEKTSTVFTEMKEAGPEAIKEFKKVVEGVRAQGMNDGLLEPFQQAFEKAFAMEPDVIYFVTDGAYDPRLEEVIRNLNKEKKVKINAVGFENRDSAYQDQLKAMAKQYSGQYKFVTGKFLEQEMGK
jgi:hypothetical protein